MEELSFDNIMSEAEVESLFSDDVSESEVDENINKNTEELIEVDLNNLFDLPESVDEEESNKGQKSTPSEEATSPNFYSSIAKAFMEDGIFSDLKEEDLKGIKDPEKFKELIENQIKSQLDEKQKRINEALEVGIEPDDIKRYESNISYLDTIKDTDILAENDLGESLRKQLIKQDFLNRGYSKERADREVKKSFNAGTDIEDAKESLSSNLEYFKKEYSSMVNEAKELEKESILKREEQSKQLKESILGKDSILGDATWDKSVRQQSYDAITKPVYTDKITGEVLTAVQKYQRENTNEFLKTVGLIYTLTDGFKDLSGLSKKQVNKQIKSSIKELESTLNNTARTSDGNLKFVSGVEEDPNSKIGKGWNLDI